MSVQVFHAFFLVWSVINYPGTDIEKLQKKNNDLEQLCSNRNKIIREVRSDLAEKTRECEVTQLALKQTSDELNQVKNPSTAELTWLTETDHHRMQCLITKLKSMDM